MARSMPTRRKPGAILRPGSLQGNRSDLSDITDVVGFQGPNPVTIPASVLLWVSRLLMSVFDILSHVLVKIARHGHEKVMTSRVAMFTMVGSAGVAFIFLSVSRLAHHRSNIGLFAFLLGHCFAA